MRWHLASFSLKMLTSHLKVLVEYFLLRILTDALNTVLQEGAQEKSQLILAECECVCFWGWSSTGRWTMEPFDYESLFSQTDRTALIEETSIESNLDKCCWCCWRSYLCTVRIIIPFFICYKTYFQTWLEWKKQPVTSTVGGTGWTSSGPSKVLKNIIQCWWRDRCLPKSKYRSWDGMFTFIFATKKMSMIWNCWHAGFQNWKLLAWRRLSGHWVCSFCIALAAFNVVAWLGVT